MRYPETTGHRNLLTLLSTGFQPSSYLEVGTREGESLLAVLKGHTPESITICDDWGSNSGGTGRGNHTHIQNLLHEYHGTIQWLDGRSQDLLPQLESKFDIVHIDGDHREEEALEDLLNGWKLANMAMAVHDVKFSSVKAAMDRFSETTGKQIDETYTGDTGTGVYYVSQQEDKA